MTEGTLPERYRKEAIVRRLKVHPAVWSILALVACLAFLAAALDGIFTVRHVTVVGANLPRHIMVQAAGVTGRNIFTVQSDQIVTRLDRVREIAVQRVETSFPDRVTIYARVRQPFVAWQDGNTLYVLDSGGRVIARVRKTRLPVIVGVTMPGPLGPGVVEAVRYGVQTLPNTPTGAVASFRFNPKTGLTIVGRSGWIAIVGMGTPQALVNRIATLVSFLSTIGTRAQQLELVDLRYRTPYARFR